MTIMAAGRGWWRVLSAKHRKKVEASLLSPDIDAAQVERAINDLVARGAIRTLDAEEGNRRTGRDDIQCESLGFNYFCEPELIRPRPDVPPISKDGKPIKYVSPLRAAYPTGNRIYYPPLKPIDSPIGLAPLTVQGFKKYLIVTEGELKGLSLALHGFFAIAFAGVWNWLSKEHEEDEKGQPIKDLDGLDLSDTLVLVLFDSDSKHNPMVMTAAHRLMAELERRGADRVVQVQLPRPSDEEADTYALWQDEEHIKPPKFGPDDFIHVRGRTALILEILESIRVDDERRAATAHLADVTADIQRRQIEKAERQAKLREEANQLVAKAIEAKDPRIVYDGAAALVPLADGDVDFIGGQLKERFGKQFNLVTLKKSVREARGEAVHLRSVRADEGTEACGMPVIRLNDRDGNERLLGELAADAWLAVCGARENGLPVVFRQGVDGLVRLASERDHAPCIKPVNLVALNGIVSRASRWVRFCQSEGGAPKTKKTRDDVIKDMLSRPDRGAQLTYLERVGTAPIFLRDGTLVSAPGFHPNAAYYLHAPDGLEIPTVPSEPSAEDIGRAKSLLLDELLVNFPFAGEGEIQDANRAHAVAMLLQPFMRDLIGGRTPLYLIEAPTEGTGKGLLSEVIGIVTTGAAARSTPLPADDPELCKKLTTELPKGNPIMFFDNLPDNRRIDFPSLAKALTEDVWTDRLMGTNVSVSASTRCMWMATGNNPRFSKEITRRIVQIRLDSKMANPDERDPKSFKHEKLDEWASRNRGSLIWACLVIIQNWIAKGRPMPSVTVPFGSFQPYSDTMAAIFELAGIPGWLRNRGELRARNDQDTKVWSEFVSAWWERFKNEPVRPMNLVELSTKPGEELLIAGVLGDGSPRSMSTKLGTRLANAQGKVFAGCRINETQGTGKLSGTLYFLEQLPPTTPAGPLGTSGNLAGTLDQAKVPAPNPSSGADLQVRREPWEPHSNPSAKIPPTYLQAANQEQEASTRAIHTSTEITDRGGDKVPKVPAVSPIGSPSRSWSGNLETPEVPARFPQGSHPPERRVLPPVSDTRTSDDNPQAADNRGLAALIRERAARIAAAKASGEK